MSVAKLPTTATIAQEHGISNNAARYWLLRLGFRPIAKVGRVSVYPAEAVTAVRQARAAARERVANGGRGHRSPANTGDKR